MYKIANLSSKERRIIITNTAISLKTTNFVVEKDLWVCIYLDVLFNKSKFAKYLTFKGGTSLSKGFNLIKRFSEDIDLIIDWEALNIEKNVPYLERSFTAQQKYNKKFNELTKIFIKEELLPELVRLTKLLIKEEVKIEIDEDDEQVIKIYYPRIFESSSVLNLIRLEIGPLAESIPVIKKKITPYVGVIIKDESVTLETEVKMIDPMRTFWEKITILHKEANRPMYKKMPSRYSRHYYDVFMIFNSNYFEYCLKNIQYLDKVVIFKNKFYRDNWANYKSIYDGKIMLIPNVERIEELHKDYESMKEMIYGEIPPFETIIKDLNELEKKINYLCVKIFKNIE